MLGGDRSSLGIARDEDVEARIGEGLIGFFGGHAEEITLQDGADELGLNKEYFCRMFKENMGISFISYVNQVRIDHIYQDLIHTDDSIQEIAERHGFYNQKLFYRMFKERYDCTPVKLRKIARDNPYLAS